MTVLRTVSVACDADTAPGCWTSDRVLEFPDATITTVRRHLRDVGWRQRQGKDVCPACLPSTPTGRVKRA